MGRQLPIAQSQGILKNYSISAFVIFTKPNTIYVPWVFGILREKKKHMSVQIERIMPESTQAEKLSQLSIATFRESHGYSAPVKEINAYIEAKLNPRMLLTELQDTNNYFHFLHSANELAGFSKITPNFSCPFVEGKRQAKLERIYLLEKFHGKQLGQQLFEVNLELAADLQQNAIWLYTWVENHRALAFYQKNGFSIVGQDDFKISDQHYNPNHILHRAI